MSHNEYPFHRTSFDTGEIPPLEPLNEATEGAHEGRTARMPGRNQRKVHQRKFGKPAHRVSTSSILAALILTAIGTAMVLAFIPR